MNEQIIILRHQGAGNHQYYLPGCRLTTSLPSFCSKTSSLNVSRPRKWARTWQPHGTNTLDSSLRVYIELLWLPLFRLRRLKSAAVHDSSLPRRSTNKLRRSLAHRAVLKRCITSSVTTTTTTTTPLPVNAPHPHLSALLTQYSSIDESAGCW